MSLTRKDFYRFGPFELEPTERRLFKDETVVGLSAREFDLLLALVEAKGSLCTLEYLMERLWGPTSVEPQNVSVHVSHLRTALGDSKQGHQYIANVRGAKGGYRLIPPVTYHRTGKRTNRAWLLTWMLAIAALVVCGAAFIWRRAHVQKLSEERRLFALALQYERQGDDEQALRALDKSIAANPHFPEAYLEAAEICNDLEQDDKTQKYLTGARDLASAQDEAFQIKIRALSLELDGELDEAMKEYQILADRFPREIDAKYHLADLALDLGRVEDADRAVKGCLSEDPRNPYCNLDSMVLMVLRNDFESVVSRYRELTAQGVEYPWFHGVVGAALLGKDDIKGAIREFEALELARKKLHGNVHLRAGQEWLASAALYTGQLQTAARQLTMALETSDSSEERASDLIYLARAQMLVGDEKSARSSAVEAMKVSGSQLTYIGAARVLAGIGEKGTMDHILSGRMPNGQQLGEVGPGNLHFIKGVFALKRGNLSEAVAELKSSYEVDDDLFTAFVLGQAYKQSGQRDQASSLFERVLNEKGAVLWNGIPSLWPLAHYELANCYAAMGESEKAKVTYADFLSLWSNADPDLQQVQAAKRALSRFEKSP